MVDTPPPDPFVSRRQVGKELGLTPYWVDQLIDSGQLRAWRVGRRVQVYRVSLDAWKAENVPAAGSAAESA